MSTLGSGHPAHSNSPRGQQPACPGEPASPDHPETFLGVSWSLLKRGHVGWGRGDVLSFCHSLLIDEENYFDLVSVSIKLSVNFN